MDCGVKKKDYFFIVVVSVVVLSYLFHLTGLNLTAHLDKFAEVQYTVVNQVWFGVVLSIVFVGFLHRLPDDVIAKLFGVGGSFNGMMRAAFAGLFLDLCSHGILIVAMKLYEKGVSLGQVICFLVASPWNSLSITIILASLIGVYWTIVFIILSLIVAVVTGLIFDRFVGCGVLPTNPNKLIRTNSVDLLSLTKGMLRNKISIFTLKQVVLNGLKSSRIVIKWLCFGIVISGLLNMFMSDAQIGKYFAPTMLGLGVTLGLATILEVCSEGLAPVAGDIFNKGKAIGNTFAFLMCGVATDYTEIMVAKETTRSWKIALFIPLVLLPQIVVLAILLN